MKIAGLQKVSLVDYPGHVAAVLFLAGCNMNCGYCHNRDLIAGREQRQDDEYEMADVLRFLEKRAGLLSGVCITGGEPTIHGEELVRLIRAIKAMGFKVKLDTNGTHPEMLAHLLEEGLLDYIAMDVKAPKEKYALVTGIQVQIEAIEKSIALIKESGIDYEFRTTMDRNLDGEDIIKISSYLRGAKRYALQQCKLRNEKGFTENVAHQRRYMQSVRDRVQDYYQECLLRGAGV